MTMILCFQEIDPATLPPAAPSLPPADLPAMRSHRPDRHWVVLQGEHAVARCSAWWTETPQIPGEKMGAVGHYAATDEQSGMTLLEHVCGELRQAGCSLAVGPMDGNTWRSYRFVTERGSEPAFFLEPNQPASWPKHFENSGFAPLAHYTSAINPDLTLVDERIERARQRLLNAGVAIRNFRAEEYDAELRRIYEVSAVSFRDNYLYTPLPEDLFIAQYMRIRERVKPELIMIAEHEERPVGYVFGLPDWLQKSRGEEMNRLIVKTVAILPGKTFGGLGNVLVSDCQQRGRELGFQSAIHALMHESNNSRNLSGRYAQTMRRYTLYFRRL